MQIIQINKKIIFTIILTIFIKIYIAIFQWLKKFYKAGNIHLYKVCLHAKFHADILIRKCCISQGVLCFTGTRCIYIVIHSFFGKLGTQINHKIWVWEGWKFACAFGQASKLIIAQNIEDFKGQNGQKRPPKLWAATAALESFALLGNGKKSCVH